MDRLKYSIIPTTKKGQKPWWEIT